jgi:hypothetical protein
MPSVVAVDLDRKEVGANEKVHSAKKIAQAAVGRNLRIFSDFNFCWFCTSAGRGICSEVLLL